MYYDVNVQLRKRHRVWEREREIEKIQVNLQVWYQNKWEKSSTIPWAIPYGDHNTKYSFVQAMKIIHKESQETECKTVKIYCWHLNAKIISKLNFENEKKWYEDAGYDISSSLLYGHLNKSENKGIYQKY